MMRALFPDGTEVRGVNATDLLAQIAKMQWYKVSIDAMKHLLAARAYGWNNSILNPDLDDDSFVKSLGETGMVFVLTEDGSDKSPVK